MAQVIIDYDEYQELLRTKGKSNCTVVGRVEQTNNPMRLTPEKSLIVTKENLVNFVNSVGNLNDKIDNIIIRDMF